VEVRNTDHNALTLTVIVSNL